MKAEPVLRSIFDRPKKVYKLPSHPISVEGPSVHKMIDSYTGCQQYLCLILHQQIESFKIQKRSQHILRSTFNGSGSQYGHNPLYILSIYLTILIRFLVLAANITLAGLCYLHQLDPFHFQNFGYGVFCQQNFDNFCQVINSWFAQIFQYYH